MNTIQVEQLSLEAFWPFGFYANCINPRAEKNGAPPIEFFRDMIQLNLGGASLASFSVCRVEPREPVIEMCEHHSACGEGILPLDNDILIHVAPATGPQAAFPLERLKVFRVPQGTLVILRPGVWHHAPFALNDRPANVLIVLPERTYANDCTRVKLAEADRIKIE